MLAALESKLIFSPSKKKRGKKTGHRETKSTNTNLNKILVFLDRVEISNSQQAAQIKVTKITVASQAFIVHAAWNLNGKEEWFIPAGKPNSLPNDGGGGVIS